jgi:hypothetical protein
MRPVIHQQRMRRARKGELLQIDRSHNAWFEDRGDKCCLIVFIDDATGHTYGKFFPAETTAAYTNYTTFLLCPNTCFKEEVEQSMHPAIAFSCWQQ